MKPLTKKAMLAAAKRILEKKSIWSDKDVFDLAYTVVHRKGD